MKKINGETKQLGLGEFTEYTYVEVLVGKPKYAEFPTGEGAKGHLDMEKSTEWAKQSAVGLIADTRRGSSDRKKGAQKMSTVGVEFGLLMIFGRSREAITFEEGYQWVICE